MALKVKRIVFLFSLSLFYFCPGMECASHADSMSKEGDPVEKLIEHAEIMCRNYAPEAARDIVKAVQSKAGADNFGIFVNNKYTLCPISGLNHDRKAIWYGRYGVIGYDREADANAVAEAVGPVIAEFGKKKQGPQGTTSYDKNGVKVAPHGAVPMFDPGCMKLFRECY